MRTKGVGYTCWGKGTENAKDDHQQRLIAIAQYFKQSCQPSVPGELLWSAEMGLLLNAGECTLGRSGLELSRVLQLLEKPETVEEKGIRITLSTNRLLRNLACYISFNIDVSRAASVSLRKLTTRLLVEERK